MHPMTWLLSIFDAQDHAKYVRRAFFAFIIGMALTVCGCIVTAKHAGAQEPGIVQAGPCMPWAVAKAQFKATYGEESVAAGVVRGSMLVVLSAPDGKTFTVMLVGPNGMACGLVAGTDWQTKVERGF